MKSFPIDCAAVDKHCALGWDIMSPFVLLILKLKFEGSGSTSLENLKQPSSW